MKAYNFTQSKYYKKRTFRLGTLWDYRNEELHGTSVGDRGEGTYKIELSEPFEVDQKLENNLFSEQHFLSCYVKGDGGQDDFSKKYFLTMTCPNLLIFSASLVGDRALYREFHGTDLCLEIPDFRKFSQLLVRQLARTHRIIKHEIIECVYTDRIKFDKTHTVPSLSGIKELKHQHQREIRLCIELLDDSVEPVTLKGKKAWKFCRVYSRKARN